MARTLSWPGVSFEELPWHTDTDERAFISKTQRRRISATYRAAIPAQIANHPLAIPAELIERMGELSVMLTRFDAQQEHRGYELPSLLLRSESAASSQIENLTSSVRNVALAELTEDAPHNALLIAGNVAAMRSALLLPGGMDLQVVLEIHSHLINRGGMTFGGELRDEQVWVGGSAFSPHGALFVPPAPERVRECLDDLLAFAGRADVNPIAKAAIFHAQFETIHPFVDGNGRCGRTLVHRILREEAVLSRATVPVSAGLLHDIDAYMEAIRAYQQGDALPIIERLLDALELAVALAGLVAARIDEVIGSWAASMTERKGSAIYRLPQLLAEQPVVDTALVADRLNITDRAARNLVERACEYGMLSSMGNRRRGVFYQADGLIEVLEEISSIQGIRRVMAG